MESLKLRLVSYSLSVLITFVLLFLLFSSLRFQPKENLLKVKLFSPQLESRIEFSRGLLEGEISLYKKEKFLDFSKEVSKIQQEIGKISENKIMEEKLTKLRQKQVQKELVSEEKVLHEKIAKLSSRTQESFGGSNLKESKEGKIKRSDGVSGSSADFSSGSNLNMEYLLLIKRKLQNNFELPIYLRTQENLYALVRLEISAEGKILNYKFLKSSKIPEFDLAVERCLRMSSPLPVDRFVVIMVEFRAEGVGKIK